MRFVRGGPTTVGKGTKVCEKVGTVVLESGP